MPKSKSRKKKTRHRTLAKPTLKPVIPINGETVSNSFDETGHHTKIWPANAEFDFYETIEEFTTQHNDNLNWSGDVTDVFEEDGRLVYEVISDFSLGRDLPLSKWHVYRNDNGQLIGRHVEDMDFDD